MVVLKKQKISNKVKASGSKKLKSDAIADNKSVESTSKKSGKVISANDLKWNNVKISKSVDVVEGFFGLEEIEGVDVKYIDGKAQFVVKDTSKLRNNSEKEVKSKKNFSLLTEEEEEELDREEEERQQAGSSGNYEEEEEEDDDDDEDHDKDNEDDDDEFTGFSDASEDESEGEAPQVTSLLNDVDNDERNDDDLDEDLLADYKENMSSNKLTNIIDENDEINNVTLDSDFIDNWSDMSLSKYSLNALSKLNFTKPTLVQKECIPIGIKNFDIIGKASTGSGKTLAYGLPILERFLLRLKENQNQALTTPIGVIFTPTRELAKQVYNHLLKIVEHYPIKNPKTLIVSITGGLSIQKQERLLSYNPGIVIATPGRFLELIELNNNDILNRLSSIEMLTLDEADRLLQDGHFGELEKIIEVLGKIRLQNHKRTKWQTLVFSATFSKALFHKLDKNVKKVAEKKNTSKKTKGKSKGKGGKGGKKFEEEESLTDDTEIIEFLKAKLQFKDKYPKLVNVNPKEIVSGSVSEALIECDATNRDLYLYYFLILYTGSTLIFTNSIDSVKRLNSFLKFLKIKAFCIHSSMLQKQRLRNLENFQKSCTLAAAASGTNKRKETVVLIATDVAARGLDIPSIDHVVHYHLPRSADLYIHRSGRTGRAGKEGVSIMLCSPQEAGGPLRRLRKLILDESIKMKKKQLEKQMAGMEDRKEAERQIAAKVEAMNDDVKLLPIQVSILDQLRERSEIAGELAESEVNKSSLSKEDSWASKVAKDLEIDDLSDFEDDVLTKNRNKKLNKQLDQKKIQGKKYQLNQLLQQRLKFGGSGGSGKYLSNGLVNMADVMLKGTGHGNIIGYDSVDVIDVIKKSQKHQERLLKLAEQKKAQKEQIEERKQIRNKKKDAKKNNKRKREELKEEQISGGEPREGFYDDDNDEFSDDE